MIFSSQWDGILREIKHGRLHSGITSPPTSVFSSLLHSLKLIVNNIWSILTSFVGFLPEFTVEKQHIEDKKIMKILSCEQMHYIHLHI